MTSLQNEEILNIIMQNEDGLNAWEKGFIESCSKNVINKRPLSSKQQACLHRIFENKVN